MLSESVFLTFAMSAEIFYQREKIARRLLTCAAVLTQISLIKINQFHKVGLLPICSVWSQNKIEFEY